jgi:hypothetical protein
MKISELEEGMYRSRGRMDAYDRDYASSVSGMGKHDSLAYRMDGGANDEGWDREEPRQHRQPAADVPHDVHIDGRKWKTFGSHSHANNVARKLQSNGKNATVHKSLEENATAGATNAGSVSIGPAYKNKPVSQPKNKDGTAKNALDQKKNLITGGSIGKQSFIKR